MTSQSKSELISELNQLLLIDHLHWELLPSADLKKLFEALVKLRGEVFQVLKLLEEWPAIPDPGYWRDYVV